VSLSDVRVIDLTRMLAGPYCTMLLADLGADVIKVEPPEGDMTRATGPFRDGDPEEALGGYFQSVNRNKRSVVLDLKSDAGRDALLALVDGADVLVENFAVGVMERFGLSFERLAARNPRLVYVCLRGFGDPRTGISPYADWPSFDIVAQAMGGLLAITGTAEGQPLKAGPGVGDIFPATLAAIGALAALHHARRTGAGQLVDVSLYDGVMALCERVVYQHSYSGESPRPQGNTHPLLCPFDVLATRDGHVAVAAPSDRHWRTLTVVLERPEWGTDPRFATNFERSRNAEEVRRWLADWCAERTTEQVVAALGGRVPIGPVNDAAALAADPHVAAREMRVTVEQPGGARPVAIAGSPIKLTATPSGIRRRAPLLGEHTEEVLAGLHHEENER
jgi:crotonobetainyl-CoA:carnitine CoA-transferase CaiB-like acyl-CoA transferase